MSDALSAALSFAAVGLGFLLFATAIQTCADTEARHPGTLTDQKSKVAK